MYPANLPTHNKYDAKFFPYLKRKREVKIIRQNLGTGAVNSWRNPPFGDKLGKTLS